MNKMKKSTVILFVLLLIVIATVVGERVFAEQIHKNNMISSTEELSQRITEELMQGNESFITYVHGMTEAQLVSINRNLDGFFGHVDSFTILRKVKSNMMMVSFNLVVSDNYYAYQSIVNDMPISDHLQASILAEKVKQVMAANQTDSDYQTVVNYHDYVVTHTKYGFLSGEDEPLSYMAEGALLRGTAVCNGYAEAMELLLLCSGIDTYMAVGNTKDGAHAWNIVKIDDSWYHVDTTWDDPVPDMGTSAMHVYLNISDEIMRKSHNWNENAYPECVKMDKNYFVKEQMRFGSVEDLNAYIVKNYPKQKVYEIELANHILTETDLEYIMQNIRTRSATHQNYEGGNYSVYRIEFQ